MYNTQFVCTYNTSYIFLETDNVSSEDEEFIRDAVYRQELLNILQIDDYNDTKMNTIINKLYKKIKNSIELKECMVKLARDFMRIDEEFGLTIMFSYDYMYATHICISEFLETGKISEINMKTLKSLIFN